MLSFSFESTNTSCIERKIYLGASIRGLTSTFYRIKVESEKILSWIVVILESDMTEKWLVSRMDLSNSKETSGNLPLPVNKDLSEPSKTPFNLYANV